MDRRDDASPVPELTDFAPPVRRRRRPAGDVPGDATAPAALPGVAGVAGESPAPVVVDAAPVIRAFERLTRTMQEENRAIRALARQQRAHHDEVVRAYQEWTRAWYALADRVPQVERELAALAATIAARRREVEATAGLLRRAALVAVALVATAALVAIALIALAARGALGRLG